MSVEDKNLASEVSKVNQTRMMTFGLRFILYQRMDTNSD